MKELKLKSIELLKKLIQTESFSTKEDKTAEQFMNSSSVYILYPCTRYYLFLPYIEG